MADKFLDFIDMIDGGGAGKFGKEFEGGGIFSVLANALATPYGSEDEERMRKLRQCAACLRRMKASRQKLPRVQQ